ncbi:MAG: hypothetical protein ACK4WM_02250, partial [Thermoflexales bacterium]
MLPSGRACGSLKQLRAALIALALVTTSHATPGAYAKSAAPDTTSAAVKRSVIAQTIGQPERSRPPAQRTAVSTEADAQLLALPDAGAPAERGPISADRQ